MNWTVYILKCSDGSLYIGRTKNIKNRLRQHNLGRRSRFTKNKTPVKIMYSEIFNKQDEAYKREFQIKGWKREKKENLIKYGRPMK